MRKLLLNVAEYTLLVFTTLIVIFIALSASFFIWVSDHKLKTVPSNITQIVSKFYSNSFAITALESLTIELTKDNNLEFNSKLFVTNPHNDIIITANNVSATLYIKQISKAQIPVDLKIIQMNINTKNIDLPENIENVFNKRPPRLLKMNTLIIKDSILTTGGLDYRLDYNLDFNLPLKVIFIPSLKNPQEGIKILQENIRTNDDSLTKILIENFPISTLNHLIPKPYRPNIFNDSLSRIDIHILSSRTSKKTSFMVKNSSKDKIIEKIYIKGDHTDKKNFNINFSIKLPNDIGTFEGIAEITLRQNIFSKTKPKLLFNVEAENINLKYLNQLWPETLEYQTREWLVSSITKGHVHKASVKLNLTDLRNINKEDLDASLTFYDLDLNYFTSHKPITNISGNAHFDLERVKLNINKGNIGNALVENSKVMINFLDPDIPLTIEAISHGHLKNFIHLLKTDNSTIFDRNIDTKKITGFADFQCKIIIPLAQEISLENSKITANGHFADVDLNVSKNINIKSNYLNLQIKNDTVSVIGKIAMNGQNATLSFISNLINKGTFDTQVSLNASILHDSYLFKPLKNKLIVHSGKMLGNFLYTSTDNIEKIKIKLNMDNAAFTIPELGLQKKTNNDAHFYAEIESSNQGPWKSQDIFFISKSEKMNISSSLEISNNFDHVISFVSDINIADNHLNFSINHNNSKESISIRSTSLDLSKTNLLEIFNYLIKEKDTKHKETSLSLQLDKIKIKNNILFKNIIGNFDCKENSCSNSGFSMKINDNADLTIKLLNKNSKNFWIIHTSNAALFLQGLDIYNNIAGGELTITLHDISNGRSPIFAGSFKMTNFRAIKTPLLTKLFILSPFANLIKIIEGKDLLPFDIMKGHFILEKQIIKLEHSFASGQYLTSTLRGNINYNNGTINLRGKIIPKSLINSIFNKQTEQEQGEAVLSTKYRIVGKIIDPEVRVHPIGVILSILTKIPLGIL
ncbi:MAG: hypothetical protein KBC27_02695 [Rickettsiales bacterium]|nr:hypothetical protein [Rickettsiales bacterium]